MPPLARADTAPPPASEPWPLTFTRATHRLTLRAAGARIVADASLPLQQAPNDCALAVVEQLQAMAHRTRPGRAWMAASMALHANGVTLDALTGTLRQLGWPAHSTRGATRLHQHPLHPPAIALMRPGHYVLLIGRTPARVEYFDPLVGLVQQPLPAFEARWTGKGVQLSAPDN